MTCFVTFPLRGAEKVSPLRGRQGGEQGLVAERRERLTVDIFPSEQGY